MEKLINTIKQNKAASLVISLLLLEALFYVFFSQRIIEWFYQGNAVGPFKLGGIKDNSIDFYIQRANRLFITFNLLGLCVLNSLFILLKFFKSEANRKNLISNVYQIQKTLLQNTYRNRKFIILASLFCGIVGLIYISFGLVIVPNSSKFYFFGADHWEMFRDWPFLDKNSNHKGHRPLILLLTKPLPILFNALTGSSKTSVALANSLYGVLAVFLAALFFWILTRKWLSTFLLTSIFALSMSQLVFSIVPEHYAIASCGVIAIFILLLSSLEHQKLYFGWWVVMGVISFGTVITNFFQPFLCFVTLIFVFKLRHKLTLVLTYISHVVSISLGLNLLQKIIFRGSEYFFLRSNNNYEAAYTSINIWNNPLLVLSELPKNFLLVNFVSPDPLKEITSRWVYDFFDRPISYSLIGLIAVTIWLGLLSLGVLKNLSCCIQGLDNSSIIFIAASLVVLFNLLLHSVFGVDEMFLYSCHYTFPMLLMVHQSLVQHQYLKWLFVTLAVTMGLNNIQIIYQMVYRLS